MDITRFDVVNPLTQKSQRDHWLDTLEKLDISKEKKKNEEGEKSEEKAEATKLEPPKRCLKAVISLNAIAGLILRNTGNLAPLEILHSIEKYLDEYDRYNLATACFRYTKLYYLK